MRISPLRSLAASLLGFIIMLTAIATPQAYVPRARADLDDRIVPPELFLHIPQRIEEGASGPGAQSAASFRARHRGRWQIDLDRRTGRPTLIQGEGVPFLPGRGNRLTAAALGLASVPASVTEAEPLARAFIAAEAGMLAPMKGELRLNEDRSGAHEDGRLWFLDFDWFVDDIPVEGARVYLRVNHGNLVQFGSSRIGPGAIPTEPTLDAAAALERAFAHAGGRTDADRVVNPGKLVILPQERGKAVVPWAGGVTYRLVWRVAFRRGSSPATWTADIDARTGEIVSFYDANRYARVTGGVYARTVTDPETERPLTRVRIIQDGAPIDTGDAGTFAYGGGTVLTTLDGTFVRTDCIGCTSPERAFTFSAGGTGDLSLGVGGSDHVGNGLSTPAERNSFYHLNRVRSLAKKWLPISWLDQLLTTYVNINDTCNAYWDGLSVNFFRSGGGCNNTGEIADVIYHEWGHGLDQHTNYGDGSTGEGTADIVSMHLTHDAMVGPGFFVGGDPVRDVDSSRVGYVAALSSLDLYCFVCEPGQCSNGPAGHEVHCEGEIYGQSQWDLASLLTTKHGFNTGWQELERIFFLSLPQADIFLPNQPGSIYDAYLAVDDDNGNLADGTPNCLEIFNAFDAHEIAGTSCGASSPGCPRPDQPVVTPTSALGRVILDWTAVPTATAYTVLRAEPSSLGAYLPLAITAGTHFEDDTVQPGIIYYYVVEAADGSGCRSTIEGAVPASPTPEARLDLTSVILDDIPAGNRSGFADPGESIDLTLPLVNRIPASTASAASGLLSASTSGVSVVNATSSYGSIPPGSGDDGSPYRAALDSGLTCGQDVDFTLDMSDGGSAPATSAALRVLIGERVPLFSDDFETDRGWTLGLGSPNATAGAWERGDPNATSWQPASGSPSGAGARCFFTGLNSGDDNGDVDGGETVLLSPLIDLSGAAAARLSYSRWWASSNTADTGDFFALDVSDDGGSTWVNVDTVGADGRALGWQPFDIRLETLVSLNDLFRIRVRAADLSGSSTVEAAIDDVLVEEIVCDLTPPCFVEPSFTGIATAVPGASCGEVDLAWDAATSNCLNAEITYNLYRSTAPGFTPGPSNLIAGGLGGLTFHDTLLSPGVEYHYLVRAFDSRSGEDSNAAPTPVTASTAPDIVAPVFSGIGMAVSGANCGETILTWSQADEVCSAPVRYDVHRSTTPGFTPGAGNRIASTLSAGMVDTTFAPGTTFYYKVRAVDSVGNSDANLVEASAVATILPLVLYREEFEASAGGWSTIPPNDASTGLWEWGDPEGTGVQPEDDSTPAPGVNAWITGLAAMGGVGGNDVDAGTTTLISPDIDITGYPGAILEMGLFFSNDAGANPNDDPLLIDLSDDGGATWTNVLNTYSPIAPWTPQQFGLLGTIDATDQVRIRVTASDVLPTGSVVEAGVDDVRIFQTGAGCSICSPSVPEVGTIHVSLAGDDVLIDWSADPIDATSYNIYLMSGPELTQFVRAGSTSSKSFLHEGAALLTGENFYYRVTAVDACGQESEIP